MYLPSESVNVICVFWLNVTFTLGMGVPFGSKITPYIEYKSFLAEKSTSKTSLVSIVTSVCDGLNE